MIVSMDICVIASRDMLEPTAKTVSLKILKNIYIIIILFTQGSLITISAVFLGGPGIIIPPTHAMYQLQLGVAWYMWIIVLPKFVIVGM